MLMKNEMPRRVFVPSRGSEALCLGLVIFAVIVTDIAGMHTTRNVGNRVFMKDLIHLAFRQDVFYHHPPRVFEEDYFLTSDVVSLRCSSPATHWDFSSNNRCRDDVAIWIGAIMNRDRNCQKGRFGHVIDIDKVAVLEGKLQSPRRRGSNSTIVAAHFAIGEIIAHKEVEKLRSLVVLYPVCDNRTTAIPSN